MRMRGVEVSMPTTPIWVSIAMRQLSTLPLFKRESYTQEKSQQQTKNKTHTYSTTATKKLRCGIPFKRFQDALMAPNQAYLG